MTDQIEQAAKPMIGAALAKLQGGDARAALAMLLEAQQKLPASLGVKLNLALAYRTLADYPGALRALNAALAIDPYFFLALLSKGMVLEQMGRPRIAALTAPLDGRPPVDYSNTEFWQEQAYLYTPAITLRKLIAEDRVDYRAGILVESYEEGEDGACVTGREIAALRSIEEIEASADIDAVIIATPDFWHAQHTVDCLEAGKHVYCEKEMSNTLEGARKMVAAARETGKLLQIGHQRRSNPRYLHCYEKLIGEANLLGRIVTVNGQWNRAVTPDLGAPDRYAIPEARLKQYGFRDMAQFRNWRWYKGLGGGPINPAPFALIGPAKPWVGADI